MQSSLHLVRYGVRLSRRHEILSREVLDKVHALAGNGRRRVSLVEITGGEPLLQPETPALAQEASRRQATP